MSNPESPIDAVEADPWTPVVTEDGSVSLHHSEFRQACHSRSGAWSEARLTYAAGARLRERAMEGELQDCRLLDVATGLGWNLAAALEALDGTGCALHALALESDPRVLRRAVELSRAAESARDYPFWKVATDALDAALAGSNDGQAVSFAGAAGTLTLRLGDGRKTLAEHLATGGPMPFDAVFLDPFSPAADPALWEWSFLDLIASCMDSRALLVTYCAASRVREGLARAGLRVGRGPGLGNKAEGTLASHAAEVPSLPARAAANLARALERPGPRRP